MGGSDFGLESKQDIKVNKREINNNDELGKLVA